MDPAELTARIAEHPRVSLCHLPTPLELMPSLTKALGSPDLLVKRDDCTGLAFGGNKARQVEFHFGRARAEGADTVLITGAVQSNYVRTVAAAAARLGMTCHVQLEDRVQGMPPDYARTGNALLDRLFGATIHTYPMGEDEDGADRSLDVIADRVAATGGHPYTIHLGANQSPVGGLGYVLAATELVTDCAAIERSLDTVVVASGSAITHAGLLVGLRALRHPARVVGACVRRRAGPQRARVLTTVRAVESLLGVEGCVSDDDVFAVDDWFGASYGQPAESTLEALGLAARCEGLVLDPVYSAKSCAAMIGLARDGALPVGSTTVFIHTGGTPALFAYEHTLADALNRRTTS